VRAALPTAKQPRDGAKQSVGRGGVEPQIYESLSLDEPRHIDDIVERSGLNSSKVLATLFNLEMKGIVEQLPGEWFRKVPL